MAEKIQFDNLNLSDRIYFYLREEIINNQMEPGSKINYDDIMEKLGVSRTPLRDALLKLQQDGLVEVKARSGSFVAIPNRKNIEDIYNVRKVLESLAVELASKQIPKKVIHSLVEEADRAELALAKGKTAPFFQADRNLHRTIINYSDNKRISVMMQSIEAQIQWFGVIITKNHARPQQANEMHRLILQALAEEEVEAAKKLMEQHIEEIKQVTLSDYGNTVEHNK
ncbi:GntR family transcriptional regulator [Halalkalibacter oceani]|uniref:GntR family transcriptional regulator n=1 Tax=Halalkalibacter oceani TaxID=1653776 RepID=A0A9X2DTL0_9BACI|nr:GntR family transcriptional regulator [Halalkalibacter oceani]MCM3716207.1 GntR family transcriptional regulator [Halalkalibacter oceani]